MCSNSLGGLCQGTFCLLGKRFTSTRFALKLEAEVTLIYSNQILKPIGADGPRFFTLSDSDKFLDQLYTVVWVTLQDLWLWGNSRPIY